MKTTLRTPEQTTILEALLPQDHSLNGGIPWGLEGQRIEIQARATKVLPQPRSWSEAVKIAGMSDAMDRIAGAFEKLLIPEPEVEIRVHLVPADLPKHGTSLDLPIAIILLQAAGILPPLPDQGEYLLIGELDIHGEVRRVSDALSLAFSALPGQKLIVPAGNAKECSLILARPGFEGCGVYPVSLLSDVVDFFKGERAIEPFPLDRAILDDHGHEPVSDFGDILGQKRAKRAAIISAAGGHHLLLIGPPGEGKSTLAKALPGILPSLSDEEKVELTRIHSASHQPGRDGQIVTRRPMREVHHTASKEALTGGGSGVPTPGAITDAHLGVLFLDEITEFSGSTLESLRQSLLTGEANVSRVGGTSTFPAQFTLVAAMNPCKCGYSDSDKCCCKPNEVRKYQAKLSGAIRDRIDLVVTIKPLTMEERFAPTTTGESPRIREQVQQARAMQDRRFKGYKIPFNAAIRERVLDFCQLSDAGMSAWKRTVATSRLSTRSSNTLAKVARTVADLDGSEHVERWHIQEAASFVMGGGAEHVEPRPIPEAANTDTTSKETARMEAACKEATSLVAGGMLRDSGHPAKQSTLF